MRTGRLVALIVGCLLVLPGLAMAVGGAALAGVYAAARDDRGYVNASLDRLRSSSVAITAEGADFGSDARGPDSVLDSLDVNLRLRVTPTGDQPVFVGIGRAAAVDAYLAGTAHDEVADVSGGTTTYRHRGGDRAIAPPGDQAFWVRSATGTGTVRLHWPVRSGSWSAVLMNADGSPGVSADVEVGTKADFVVPLGLALGGLGLVVLTAGVVLVVVGATGGRAGAPEGAAAAGATGTSVGGERVVRDTPVTLAATLDPTLSRWQWLVKWFLAIPHFVVLAFLWVAFVVLSVVAFFAILFTGRYPRSIFDVNVGVLRWTWRVSYYATTGGLGTDRYPPFSLSPRPGDPATLDIEYPQRLSRGLVLVKWWLLAIPHYVVLAVLLGGSTWAAGEGSDSAAGTGLLSILVFVAAVVLLFTGRYPRSLFDLVIGLNRWVFRVVAYAALMTDAYPPFRLDQGGAEPAPVAPGPAPAPPDAGAEADLPGPRATAASDRGVGTPVG
jgi:Domain of unknown function (DUF4389)